MSDAEHYTMLANQYYKMAQTYREMVAQAVSNSQRAEYIRKEQANLKMAAEYERKARAALYEEV